MVIKNIFGCMVSAESWAVASARFQIWARQHGLTDAESLAYILAGQNRLGEYHSTEEEFQSAKSKLDGKMPIELDFSRTKVQN